MPCDLCVKKDASRVVSNMIDLNFTFADRDDVELFIKFVNGLDHTDEEHMKALVDEIMEME